MIDQTWAPSALNVSATAGGAPILANTIFSAQTSTDGKTLVLRYVNFASGARTRLFCFCFIDLKTCFLRGKRLFPKTGSGHTYGRLRVETALTLTLFQRAPQPLRP
eukprot:COSAG06_NODE_15186_length_1091_cov_2.063508_2_plen_105_part_01